MSALATARPLRAPQTTPRPHIEIVPTRQQRRARPRAAYAVVTIASLFAIFGAQLLLSIVVSDGAYQIQSLQSQRKELQRSEQALAEQLGVLRSSQSIAARAAQIGMVPSETQFAIDLSTGAVFQLPGMAGGASCGAACVTNTLVSGAPLVPVAPTAPQPQQPAVVDALPAPVTR